MGDERKRERKKDGKRKWIPFMNIFLFSFVFTNLTKYY